MRLLPPLAPASLLRRPSPPCVPSGIASLDHALGGLPRGSLTEIFGPPSSGRTTLVISALRAALEHQEAVALVDATDAFDPASAAEAGLPVQSLLWVRCGGDPERALKAADRILNAGGFGLLVLDLADVPRRILQRIPLLCWFRLRRAVEGTPTVLLVVTPQPCTSTCASLLLEMRSRPRWSGAAGFRVLEGGLVQAVPRKPVGRQAAVFPARAQWVR